MSLGLLKSGSALLAIVAAVAFVTAVATALNLLSGARTSLATLREPVDDGASYVGKLKEDGSGDIAVVGGIETRLRLIDSAITSGRERRSDLLAARLTRA